MEQVITKTRREQLARAAARNPQNWTARRLGPVLFETTCSATGDRFEVVSAYGRVHFVENMGGSRKTYRVDLGPGAPGCECPDHQVRQLPFGTVCKHCAATLAVTRFTQAEKMIDAPPAPEAAEPTWKATEQFLSEIFS